ncbi:MAG: aminotransferase class I/II-fold pyridoxal phosphate-dependent enzyme, partial [Promethearchaeota archaeon]
SWMVRIVKLNAFEMERMQSEWENIVEINLTESGVSPLSIADLIHDTEQLDAFLKTSIGYSQTNGTVQLRETIAAMYEGATADNVLVTNGGAEANFITIWNLLYEHKHRNEIVMMLPNYMQMHGLTRGLGGKVVPYYLQMEGSRWLPDLEGLKNAVSSKTAAIVICNPNNPTGAIFDTEQLKAISDIAADVDTWVISDEIYQGAELDSEMTPTIFGMYNKVIVTNSLSKAYGLPGLRLGWLLTSEAPFAKELWSYSDYTTIGPGKLSDMLATIALQPEMRKQILGRTAGIVKKNWNILKGWLNERSDIFEYIPPQAAAICFPKHNLPISSLELVGRLLREKSLLIIPGEYFGMERYLRIGFGYSSEKLIEGLSKFDELLRSF